MAPGRQLGREEERKGGRKKEERMGEREGRKRE